MDNYNTTKLTLTMSPMDVFVTMSEGNPGALQVLLALYENGNKIDPMDFMGPFGAIFSLDRNGIYGSRIWMLFKDVCGKDLGKTVAMLRSIQLGLLKTDDLDIAINNRGEGIDVDALVEKVIDTLPEFHVNAATEQNKNETETATVGDLSTDG